MIEEFSKFSKSMTRVDQLETKYEYLYQLSQKKLDQGELGDFRKLSQLTRHLSEY